MLDCGKFCETSMPPSDPRSSRKEILYENRRMVRKIFTDEGETRDGNLRGLLLINPTLPTAPHRGCLYELPGATYQRSDKLLTSEGICFRSRRNALMVPVTTTNKAEFDFFING